VGLRIGLHMGYINNDAINWLALAIPVMLLAVWTLYTCGVTARKVRDNLQWILVPMVARLSMFIVTWSCEGTRAP
jgi:uncharacterized membrane protein YcfT